MSSLEQEPQGNEGKRMEEESGAKSSAHFTRHSKAKYGTYRRNLGSEAPEQDFDPRDQEAPDVPEEGVELAHEKANELLDQFDPENDKLFFASSNEARAVETANIYRQVAEERGFEIIAPEKSESALAGQKEPAEKGEESIRIVKNLSLGHENLLAESVFNPASRRAEINWEEVPQDVKERYDKAAAIIDADDHGSFGANFYHHGKEIKELFPELEDAQGLYDKQFKKLRRLAEWGINKAEESGGGSVRILAFGHENYMGEALNEYFGEHDIGNCETVSIRMDDDGSVTMERRGDQKEIE